MRSGIWRMALPGKINNIKRNWVVDEMRIPYSISIVRENEYANQVAAENIMDPDSG